METNKALFHLSWLTSLYFLFLALDTYFFKINFVLLGVIRELITLPLMAGQFIICLWCIFYGIKHGFSRKGFLIWTFLIALTNSIIVVCTFAIGK